MLTLNKNGCIQHDLFTQRFDPRRRYTQRFSPHGRDQPRREIDHGSEVRRYRCWLCRAHQLGDRRRPHRPCRGGRRPGRMAPVTPANSSGVTSPSLTSSRRISSCVDCAARPTRSTLTSATRQSSSTSSQRPSRRLRTGSWKRAPATHIASLASETAHREHESAARPDRQCPHRPARWPGEANSPDYRYHQALLASCPRCSVDLGPEFRGFADNTVCCRRPKLP